MNTEDEEPSAHDWVEDGVDVHNHEYWYRCTRCGATDWIPSYGTLDQLKPEKCEK